MAAHAQRRAGDGLGPAFAAVRVRIGLCSALVMLAAVGWWWTTHRMSGMDTGPWAGLGTLGWFLGVWVVMMAAMMYPAIAPTIALYSRMTRARAPMLPVLFAVGYLIVWTGAGLLTYAIGVGASRLFGVWLAWGHAGRILAAATLLLTAAYEFTPLKDVCLGKCRSPLGFLLSSWRDGSTGALRMGAANGAWCVGCCWALMASLFALGIMSITWMAVIAGVITIEKTLPWRRVATYATAALFFTLGMLMLVAPDLIPALTIPHSDAMPAMLGMAF